MNDLKNVGGWAFFLIFQIWVYFSLSQMIFRFSQHVTYLIHCGILKCVHDLIEG